MEKNFLSLIKMRRSVRAYKSEPVLSKALDVVLEAGTYAPTGGRHQSPTIIAITDSKYRRAIALDYPAQEAGQPAARKQNYIVRTICGEEGKLCLVPGNLSKNLRFGALSHQDRQYLKPIHLF